MRLCLKKVFCPAQCFREIPPSRSACPHWKILNEANFIAHLRIRATHERKVRAHNLTSSSAAIPAGTQTLRPLCSGACGALTKQADPRGQKRQCADFAHALRPTGQARSLFFLHLCGQIRQHSRLIGPVHGLQK